MATLIESDDVIYSSPPKSTPRSHRVGMASPPAGFNLSSSTYEASSPSPPSSPHASPPIPPRSPLRPPPRRSISSSANTPPDSPTIADSMFSSLHLRNRSFVALLLESLSTQDDQLTVPDKQLPPPPDSPISLSPLDGEITSSASSLVNPPPLSKRDHALLELLSSERAYASDLALIRTVHIPLALGEPPPFHAAAPVTPPHSSGSSSRTLSTSSDSSTTSSATSPPMTQVDVKIIFSNVPELALFSDQFTEMLEEALGSVLEGGQGEDHVGALFLETIPSLEPPYRLYITRHPSALAHLGALPQTPALATYLAHTRTLAASLTHAWDLASLLIKPVQRLLKYPLLLGAILDETPDSHGDKENLRKAKAKMEEVARGVNEGRRRWEVVKEVLTSKPGEGPKKKGININVAASVNLGRMKNLRTSKPTEGNEEATQVEQMVKDLKKTDVLINDIAKGAMDWCATARVVMDQLRNWAIEFGKVIGLSDEQQSEAFDAFLIVVQERLVPLCAELESVIKTALLQELSRLVATTHSPLRLIDAMNTLEPLHYGLLNINFAKSRPPATLLEASQSYLALRGQLYSELPQYLALLNKGVTASIFQLGRIQAEFWGDVRDRWGELWDALRVEGEMNAGAEETLRVWWERWIEVDRLVTALTCVNPKKQYTEKIQPTKMAASVSSMTTSSDAPRSPPSRSSSSSFVLPSLDPLYVSAPFPLSPSAYKGRNRGDSLSSTTRRYSNESLQSGKSGRSVKSGKSYRHSKSDEFGEYVAIDAPEVPPIPIPVAPRTKTMPTTISVSSSYSGLSHSAPRSPVFHDDMDDYEERGRIIRKSSLRRKLADSFRAPSSHHRSSSVKSLGRSPPSSSPRGATFVPPPNHATSLPPSRTSWEHARAKYLCRVVHPCDPPDGVSYNGRPFFRLAEDDVFEVLHEAGHPLTHHELPLYVDDGEDCLLLVRNRHGKVGWALASFLIPED